MGNVSKIINTKSNNNTSLNQTSFSSATYIEPVSESDIVYFDSNNYYQNNTSVFKRTGSTIVTGFNSLLEGIGQLGEAIVDTGTIISSITPNIITLGTGIYDTTQAIYSAGKGTINSIKNDQSITDSIKKEFENYESLTIKNFENTRAFVEKDYVKSAYDNFYEQDSWGKRLANNSYGYENVRGIGSGVGYVGGIVALSVATMGAGAIATSASSLSSTMGVTAATAGFGKGTQNAWNDGASNLEGLAYGAASGAWEGAQFYAGGQINALNVGSNAIANAGIRVGLDAATGAAEGLVRPGIDKIYKDETYEQLFESAGGWKNVGTQAAMAGTMSAIGEASGLAKKFRYEDEAMSNIDNASRKLTDEEFEIKLNEVKSNSVNSTIQDIDYLLKHENIDLKDAGFLNEKYFAMTGHNHPKMLSLRDQMDYSEIYNGVGPAEFAFKSNNPNNLMTNSNSAYRITGLDQIDDIEYSGVVRPKGYGSRSDRVGLKVYWTTGGDISYGDKSRAIIEVPLSKLENGQKGPVSLNDINGIWVFSQEDNAFKNIIDEVKTNHTSRTAANNIKNASRTIASNANELSLKEQVLSTIKSTDNDITKARKIYVELNKRVGFDVEWTNAHYKQDLDKMAQIYNKSVSFDNLPNDSVICKSWSSLYKEALVDAGVDESKISIKGLNLPDERGHKWVEIITEDGTIVADATNNIAGSFDLINTKFGEKTTGFYLLDEYTGKKDDFSDELIDRLDESIGYVTDNSIAQKISLLKSEFGNSDVSKSVIDGGFYNDLVKQNVSGDIPIYMDGQSLYSHNKSVIHILDDTAKKQMKVSNGLYATSGGESVNAFSSIVDGKAYYQSYSKSTGKVVYNSEKEFRKYLSTLREIKK